MSVAKNAVDQKEYLKKYLGGDKKKKKKKDKKHNVKIIDDYVFASEDVTIEIEDGEDAPQIVGEILLEQPKVEKWRSIVIKDEPDEDDEKETQMHNKANIVKIKDEFPLNENGKSRKHRSNSNNSDLSPPRRKRHDRNARNNSQKSDSDLSPPRRKRHDRNNLQNSDYNLSPPLRKRTYDRNERNNFSTSEQKRVRSRSRRNSREQQSPVLIERSTIKREILTPKRCDSHDAQTPPRWSVKESHQNSPRLIKSEKKTRWEHTKIQERSLSPPPTHKAKITKTLDGKKAGLQHAQSLQAENNARRQEENRKFEQMSTDISGRDAEVAVRNSGRRGKRAQEAQDEDPQERLAREERDKAKKVIFDRWGKGLKQVEDRRTQMEEEAYESTKPLARYSNDADLDKYLREKEYADDPMLQYMREKKREQMKELNIPVMPKYEGSYPENRFAILPGYRWDGVDRSNGYEKRWFEVRNEKRAREEEAYKYSVEDM